MAGNARGQTQDGHGNRCDILDCLDDAGERIIETQAKRGARTETRGVAKLLFADDGYRPTTRANVHPHSSLGYLTPDEFAAGCRSALEQDAA